MEPYKERSAASIADDIRSTVSTYAKHPSAAKIDGKLIFYLYDSYQVQSSDWARVIPAVNDIAYTIGLLVEFGHLEHVIASRFSAAYSYFAAIDFSFGCTPKNWKRNGSSKIFIIIEIDLTLARPMLALFDWYARNKLFWRTRLYQSNF